MPATLWTASYSMFASRCQLPYAKIASYLASYLANCFLGLPKEHDTRGESTFITVASLDSKYHQVVIKMYEIFEKKCNKKVRHGLDFMMQDGSNANVYDQVAHQDYDRPFLNALLHVDGPGAFY